MQYRKLIRVGLVVRVPAGQWCQVPSLSLSFLVCFMGMKALIEIYVGSTQGYALTVYVCFAVSP